MADYEFPDGLLFTRDDEWIRVEDDQVVIGVSDFAQNQLGDIVFVELPDISSETVGEHHVSQPHVMCGCGARMQRVDIDSWC